MVLCIKCTIGPNKKPAELWEIIEFVMEITFRFWNRPHYWWREDGGCYARTLHSHCGRTARRRHDRRRGSWSEDFHSQKPLLRRRPCRWTGDSCACEHEELSDGAIAAVICRRDF